MRKIILLTSFLSLPVLAKIEPPQFFIGVKGGYQWAQDDDYNNSSPDGAIVGINGGLKFTPSLSWDIGYQYHDELKADTVSVNVKTWLIESALRYDWYLQDNLSLYGRLGIAYWDMGKSQPFLNKEDANGFSPLGEMGVSYNFNSNIRLSAGYQYIDSIGKSNTGKYDSNGVLLGLTYTFGGETQPELVETAATPTIKHISLNGRATKKPFSKTQTFSPKIKDELFDSNSIEPNHNYIEQLTSIASILNSSPQAQAVVIGYADSIGSIPFNQKLSERRASTIANKLIGLGVTPTQVEWRGGGESGPIADNETVEGRARNRRVEIIIHNFQDKE